MQLLQTSQPAWAVWDAQELHVASAGFQTSLPHGSGVHQPMPIAHDAGMHWEDAFPPDPSMKSAV